MAELLAIHKDLKNLSPLTSLNKDGSAQILLTGNSEYHPELRLTKADVVNILKGLLTTAASPAPVEKEVSTKEINTWEGYTASNPMPSPLVPYEAASPFNERVPVNPSVLANSAAMVAFTLGNGGVQNLDTGGAYGHPIYYAANSDPIVTLEVTGAGASETNGLKIKCPIAALPATGSDGHMCIVQPNGQEIDLWQATRPNAFVIKANGGGLNSFAGSGVGGGATAANFALSGGIIRAPELAAALIPHALFASVWETRKGFVSPATHTDGTSTNINAPYEGQRFYLDYTDAEIAALKLLPWKAAIITAAAHYGIYVGDSGSDGLGFQFESSVMYTAFGLPDPFVSIAKANDLPLWEGKYVFGLASGVDWSRLKAIVAPAS